MTPPEFEWDAQKAAENFGKHRIAFDEAAPKARPDANAMRDGYDFDYSKAKPNRFAVRMKRPVVSVVLEPDVASVFDSSAKVNAQLRSIIARRRSRNRPVGVAKRRHKAG